MKSSNYTKEKITLPMIVLRGIWIFPHMVMHFDVGREKSIKALEEAILNESRVILCSQKDFKIENPEAEDIYDFGCVAVIKQTLKLPQGVTRVLVEGVERVQVNSIDFSKPFIEAKATSYKPVEGLEVDEKTQAAMRLLIDDIKEYAKYSTQVTPDAVLAVSDIEDPERIADIIASYMDLKLEKHYLILSELNIYKRLETLHKILREEIELLKIEDNINKKVRRQMDKSQREYFLKEQLNVIRSELGEDDFETDVVDEYLKKIDDIELSEEAETVAKKEVQRLSQMGPMSPEVNVTRTYLDHLLALPWGKYSDNVLDIKKSRDVLNSSHSGLDKVKERILEYIAVLKKTGSLSGSILCLVGPPGVGKTSIARSIAEAMGREFVSMRLGGVRDEAEIRGHRKTYIASMPGRIIASMTKASTMNPVFLLDEIDKMASDFRGDPASALLEVLDPEQNDEFLDHYLEVVFDLSETFFITTANSLSTIPDALRDRMEIIRLSGYTQEEKMEIAKSHLLPKLMKKYGFEDDEFSISSECIKFIIKAYTREAGVRELERKIAQIIRHAVKTMVEDDKKKIKITKNNLIEFAGKPIFFDDDFINESKLGVVTGLAWTEVGGEILEIEVNTMLGTGKVQLTGQLGDVMKESAMAGLSYIRANADSLGIKDKEFYKNLDIHIHIPEGAIPKDGPSAGTSMTTAMISALTGRMVKPSYAMTGEITLQGRVLRIGGVKEKILAAKRYSINNIILPYENQRDVNELTTKETSKLNFKYVKNISEIIETVLEKDAEDK